MTVNRWNETNQPLLLATAHAPSFCWASSYSTPLPTYYYHHCQQCYKYSAPKIGDDCSWSCKEGYPPFAMPKKKAPEAKWCMNDILLYSPFVLPWWIIEWRACRTWAPFLGEWYTHSTILTFTLPEPLRKCLSSQPIHESPMQDSCSLSPLIYSQVLRLCHSSSHKRVTPFSLSICLSCDLFLQNITHKLTAYNRHASRILLLSSRQFFEFHLI